MKNSKHYWKAWLKVTSEKISRSCIAVCGYRLDMCSL